VDGDLSLSKKWHVEGWVRLFVSFSHEVDLEFGRIFEKCIDTK